MHWRKLSDAWRFSWASPNDRARQGILALLQAAIALRVLKPLSLHPPKLAAWFMRLAGISLMNESVWYRNTPAGCKPGALVLLLQAYMAFLFQAAIASG